MSGTVGTTRASSNRQSGTKDKMTKSERNSSLQQQQSQITAKTETQTSKMQPTQEQLRLAQIMDTTNKSDADPNTVRELMEMTDKSEDDVRIALHDAENDANIAVMILLDGGNEQQGVWREQGGKRKKKVTTPSSQKEGSNHLGDENFEGRNKDREDRDREGGSDHHDLPPRRGRRNGGPPPRLARGRGRDRGNFGDRENKDRNIEEWNNERVDDKRDRSGGDRGRSRGRGGFGARRSGGPGGGRGRFNNSGDRDSRSYNRVPRYEKKINTQPMDGPEIDTWTNETAETNTSKDTDWDNWNDTWVNEEDQWTGSLEDTKVFTPSQMKVPEPEPVISEPPSSRGQRVDVGSLFIESAKFAKAPDYSKPSGDAYINHFNQTATESIKNSIGIGSSSRPPQSLSSLDIQQQSMSNSLGLSSLNQSSGQVQAGVLSSLPQQGPQSVTQTLTHLSQISMDSQESALGDIGAQVSRVQALSVQSRIPSVIQQQQQQQNISIPTSMSNILQQRPKPQKSKLPPPSKIPASAVEMPGHIPRNPQLDLQFGIDFGVDSGSSFDFGTDSDNVIAVTSTYSTTPNGTPTVITNHLGQPGHVNISNDGSLVMSNILPTTSVMESQHSNRSAAVFHSSVYTSSSPQNEPQNLDRDQNKMSGSEPIPYASQLELKTGTLMSQLTSQTNQNLSSGSLPQNKNETSYSSANGYTSSSYQSHQKTSRTQTQSYTTNSQVSQTSSFQGQYPASQSVYPSAGQGQFSNPPNAAQFVPTGQTPTYNNAQNQYSSGQNQFASSGSSTHPSMPHANHQSQYSSGPQNSYTSGQSPYSGYQTSSSFPSHSPSQANYPSNQTSGTNSSIYPVSTQPSNSFTSQATSYQSPSAGSYHPRDSQTSSSVSTQSSAGVTFPTAPQSSLKPATSQTNTNYNSQSYSAPSATLQQSPLTNKLGDGLSKMTLKDDTTLDGIQTSQLDHSNTSVTTVSTTLSLPSVTSAASLSTGKAPPNLPPGVPLMGQYIMGQSTMPPFYSVQPPLYGYEDVQLLQQRMPLQTGSYYDMSAFPTQTGPTLPTGRDQQPPIPNVPFSGTTADASKMARVDAQSPNSSSQPQNAHSAAQQPLFNFHYGYYYPSMFPGGGLQYPMFPIPPVTNAAAHAGTTANTQFHKTYASHVYTTKGYDELNQAQDFSKTGYGSSPTGGKASGTRMSTRAGSSEITPNTYNKSHTQTYDKQGFHGGTPPPFSLPIASATQAGPMGGPTTPYATAPFLPIMAAHQLHHPIQQDSTSSSSRGLNQAGSQAKTGAGKSYGVPYWNN
uniref:UBA domain-containing protein n=1 Tax=Arion vulgaris TaxID=1028688 RepID=A0A0B7BCL0_9EUPU